MSYIFQHIKKANNYLITSYIIWTFIYWTSCFAPSLKGRKEMIGKWPKTTPRFFLKILSKIKNRLTQNFWVLYFQTKKPYYFILYDMILWEQLHLLLRILLFKRSYRVACLHYYYYCISFWVSDERSNSITNFNHLKFQRGTTNLID